MTIEEAAAVSVAEEAAVTVVVALDQAVHERCIKQLVQTVSRKLKCLLNLVVTDLCTAENASKNINLQDTNSKRTHI